MQAIAELRGWAAPIGLEIPCNLIERTVERDLIPMAQTMGSGVICWSRWGRGPHRKVRPLRPGTEPRRRASRRKQVVAGNGFLTARAGHRRGGGDIAAELGTTPSRVALARTLLNPPVTAPIVGARSLAQLDDNLGALDVRLDPARQARLAEVSAIELGFPCGALRRLDLTR